jgi:hypothetical protein
MQTSSRADETALLSFLVTGKPLKKLLGFTNRNTVCKINT